MKNVLLGFTVVVAIVAAAQAAELPTMRHARTEHYKTCSVGGMAGVQIPGSDTCVKLGGYVSGGFEVGGAKQYDGASSPHN